MIHYIIRARATAMTYAEYFAVCTPNGLQRHMDMLIKSGWFDVEAKAITNRDRHIEGCLKRCRIGGERERANLQAYYKMQP